MADNVRVLDPAAIDAEGPNVATEDIDGKHFQKVKITAGVDGRDEGTIGRTNPLPTEDAGGTDYLLQQILAQLQVMNMHLSIISELDNINIEGE